MFKHLQEMTTLNEAAAGHGFFQAKQYSDPGDFTDEFYDLLTSITKMKKVMKNPKWLGYMQATDDNSGTSTVSSAESAIRAISDLESALSDLDQQFDKINIGDPYKHDDDDAVDTSSDDDSEPASDPAPSDDEDDDSDQ